MTNAHADESGYIVTPANGTIQDSPYIDNSDADFTYTFWEFPLRIKISAIIGLLLGTFSIFKFSPLLLAKIKQISKSRNRESIFEYIVSNPGCSVVRYSGILT
ncbi:hypothetical protein [Methanococcoides burtonii]|uniref:hypothetical protein n=1 Tax=Methanococcoides burtonii TaxID=29291 RepID=UPI0012F635CD|nr:hypothetical protein [Methanococcoides burtonii]